MKLRATARRPTRLVERAVERDRAGRTDGPELAETVRGAVTHLTALGGDGSAGGQGDGQDEHGGFQGWGLHDDR